MRLNRHQEKAVQETNHSVVVACPGSGKTRVLVEKAAHLRKGAPDADIIIVTFTRQAADELRRRLTRKMASLARLRVATFHSLALQQLMGQSSSRICGPSEQQALLRGIAEAHLLPEDVRRFQQAADAYASGVSSALDNPDFQAAYDAYLELLAKHSALDVSHAILSAVNAMEAGEIHPFPCDYLLVDEVQDIDPTQIRWVVAHTKNGARLTVVGDDDQSIYGWRHSQGYRGMRQLEKHHRATVITLSTNYRSHDPVLGLAIRLIGHNVNRVPKDLFSAKGPGGSAHLHSRFWSDHDEALSCIEHAKAYDGKFAIIARTNRKLNLVASLLAEQEIPFSRPGGNQFWEAEEPALFLRLIGPVGLRDPLVQTILNAYLSPQDKAGRRQLAFNALDRALRAHPTTSNPNPRAAVVRDWLLEFCVLPTDPRRERFEQMVQLAHRYFCEMPGNLIARLEAVSRPKSTKEERIVLLTMHGAKGREFPGVWIIGCQDGTIPSRRSADLEEERRLLYVAITRAERDLNMSFAWNQLVDGGDSTRRLTPSRFLTVDMGLPVPEREQVPRPKAGAQTTHRSPPGPDLFEAPSYTDW